MRKFAPEGKFGTKATSTITQTFATADATHAARTYAAPTQSQGALTVADGTGTNNGTIDAITDNATTIAAVQELAAAINQLRTDLIATNAALAADAADLADTAGVLNSVVDALQARSILG